MKKNIKVLVAFLLLIPLGVFSEVVTPVKWSAQSVANNDGTADLFFTATIQKGWHLYSPEIPDGGPIPTSLHLRPSARVSTVAKFVSDKKAISVYDSMFAMQIGYYANSVTFKQKVKITGADAIDLAGYIEYMVCDDQRCLPPENFEFKLAITPVPASKQSAPIAVKEVAAQMAAEPAPAVVADTVPAQTVAPAPVQSTEQIQNPKQNKFAASTAGRSLLWIFIAGFLGGLLALLTPCVFPMIPMTVSVFMKMGKGHRVIRNALFYGAAIVLIYVSLGFAVTAIFGADALNALSTNPVFNVIFFILLVVFASAFLGAFELQLPTSWANFFDRKVDRSQGFASILFMAFTLALVSFSCTGPIIGTLLVEAAVSGNALAPITGMVGFSLALALPFTLFAMFPSMLKALPRSGGWLNSVKVVLGFLELAFAFKFLSTADLAAHWGILPRELFLSIWIIIFAALGFYLLGKLRLEHDDELEGISVTRLLLAFSSFIFALWLVPGLWGAPLKAISAFPPPLSSQEWQMGVSQQAAPCANTQPRKFSDLFHCPSGMDCYFDLDEGLAAAKAQNKPVLIDFTGHGCVNCRRMEASVLTDPEILKILSEQYIIVSLYVDDRTDLPANEQVDVEIGGMTKTIRTIGNKWSAYQTVNYMSNSQPYYVVVDAGGNQLIPARAYDLSIPGYIQFLNDGREAFRKK